LGEEYKGRQQEEAARGIEWLIVKPLNTFRQLQIRETSAK
jgi:hypothetical protein